MAMLKGTKKSLIMIYMSWMVIPIYCSLSCNPKSCIVEKYPNGQVLTRRCYDKNGLRHGEYVEYHDNGKINIKCNYLNDSLNGDYHEYHFNGQLRYSILYDMNRMVEFRALYDEGGSPLMVGSFHNGNGVLNKYNRQGKLRTFGNYVNGLKTGYWKIVANNGIVDSVLFIDGMRASSGHYEFLP